MGGKFRTSNEENSAPKCRGFNAFLIDREKNHLYCCVVYTARKPGPAARGRSSGLEMLRPITTSSASASSAPSTVQASAAATLSANGAQATTVAAAEASRTQTGASSAEQMLRYNSFQFIYRQDIGRIVLIGQSPETGERVIQVPSEQVLRAYERTVRVERQMARQQGDQAPSSAAPFGGQAGSQPAPQLAKALAAAVGGANNGSGVVSLSA